MFSLFFKSFYRSELYGGSGARLSHGASGVKSAESVLRLIESNSTSRPSLIPSSSTTSSQPRVKNSFLACDNSVSRLVTEKQSLGIKTSALSRLKVTTQGNIDDFNFGTTILCYIQNCGRSNRIEIS